MPQNITQMNVEFSARLQGLYATIDRQIAGLLKQYPYPLACRAGCRDCCMDGLTVFEVEAANIIHHAAVLLGDEEPFPPGQCAFLNSAGECRIYEYRPYVCRTQGLPLRWEDENTNGDPVEMRDICPLNEPPEPLTLLPTGYFWTIGSVESELARLQIELGGKPLRRIALRDLFQHA